MASIPFAEGAVVRFTMMVRDVTRAIFRERVGVQWRSRHAYDLPGPIPWRIWIYSTAHDDYSWFWRVLGLEVNVMREDNDEDEDEDEDEDDFEEVS